MAFSRRVYNRNISVADVQFGRADRGVLSVRDGPHVRGEDEFRNGRAGRARPLRELLLELPIPGVVPRRLGPAIR